jgi:hypothetical protein
MAVTQSQQFDETLTVFRAGIARQIQVFKKLVSDAHPALIQGCPETTIGQFKNGYV